MDQRTLGLFAVARFFAPAPFGTDATGVRSRLRQTAQAPDRRSA